jgi:hypothetical protein
MKRLKFVILDCAFENWTDKAVPEMLARIISLKKRGYQAEYKPGVLPVDTSDFIGTHLAVCKETAEGLIPIMAYRSITKSRCQKYNLSFSPLQLMRACNALEHEKAVQLFMQQSDFKKEEISYDASWTIDPEVRKDKEYTKKLQELMMATHVLYHLNEHIPRIIAGGVVRFKMYRFYQFWGYRPFMSGNIELPAIKVPFVHDELTQFFMLSAFSKEALELADSYRKFWDTRVIIGGNTDVKKAA